MDIKSITAEDITKMMELQKRLNPDLEVSNSVKESLDLWVKDGIMPGGFLMAVLRNDLFGALRRADSYNRASIFQIVEYINNEIPSDCWGSADKMEKHFEAACKRHELVK